MFFWGKPKIITLEPLLEPRIIPMWLLLFLIIYAGIGLAITIKYILIARGDNDL